MPPSSSWSGFAGLVLGFVVASALLVVPVDLGAQRTAVNPTGRAYPRAQPPPDAGAPTCITLASLTTALVTALDDAGQGRLAFVPGEVLLKFRASASPIQRQRALSALRSRPPMSALEWRGDVARLRDDLEPDADRLARTLSAQPEVEFAQPNYIRRIPGHAGGDAVAPLNVGPGVRGTPNDPDYRALQWNLSLLNMPSAWDINDGGSPEVIVAVIDTGLTTSAATLNARLWTGQQFQTTPLRFASSPDLSATRIVAPRDLIFDVGSSNTMDLVGHGTHVASTIAEDANNQISLTGMAYNVRIMPVKVCVGFWELMLVRAANNITGYLPSDAGFCSDDAIGQGIRYAVDNGARVLNLSLGGGDPSPAIRDALGYAVGKGAFVAIAMGNGFEAGNAVDYPAAYAPGIDGVMSVGAIGKSKTRAYYSSTGSHAELAAPGGNDRDGGGEDRGYVWQVTLIPSDVDPIRTATPRFDRYAEVGYLGTSMATPHVAAAAALLMSQGVTSPKAIELALRQSALDLGTAGKDDEFGYGLVQPRAALFGSGISR